MKRAPINAKRGFAGSWVVSENEEWFSSAQFCTRAAAVEHAAAELDLGPGETFFVARVVAYPRTLNIGDGRRVLEEAGERSECCEDTYERMSNALTEVEGEADEDLQRVLSAWLRRWGLHPNQHGFSVEKVESVEVPTCAGDLLDEVVRIGLERGP